MTSIVSLSAAEQELLAKALSAARDTEFLFIGSGLLHQISATFESAFRGKSAIIVADNRTFAAAGLAAQQRLEAAGITDEPPIILPEGVTAGMNFVEWLTSQLKLTQSIPIAVGSGTINDLTKLASYRLGRPYFAIATAASMDGYTAFGASITDQGSKQTFECPAPRAVLADLEVICQAPTGMNASGYADLLAKGVAGADWILADVVGVEEIDDRAWPVIQTMLPTWVAQPEGIATHNPQCLLRLTMGLMMSGFAMQTSRSSRPASGAEHQFSHLWDMQQHSFRGSAPSHGFKVGIGSLASVTLYQFLLQQDWQTFDIESAVKCWPSWNEIQARIKTVMGTGNLGRKAIEETQAKFCDQKTLRVQLTRIRDHWPMLKTRLENQLSPFQMTHRLLEAAGAPSVSDQIGISQHRLRESFEQAYYVRRRFTVLDWAMRTGIFNSAMNTIFGSCRPSRSGDESL